VANHSLSVVAIGLGVLADVTGSAALIWRFRAEQRQPGQSRQAETCAAIIVTAALAIVSAVITIKAAVALATGLPARHIGGDPDRRGHLGCRPDTPGLLQTSPRHADGQPPLQGDDTLSGIGAATSVLALTALLYHALGWWWADRIAALMVAAIAAVEAWHTAPRRPANP
jgi:divalent metal cation (Fe/Co/Zn/Cd) transporter